MTSRHARRISPFFIALSALAGCDSGGHTVSTSVTPGGAMAPGSGQTVQPGASASFTLTPQAGYMVDGVSGCGGSLAGNTYTTGPVTADCTVTARFVPELKLRYGVKQLRFGWPAVNGATRYRLLEGRDTGEGFKLLAELSDTGVSVDVALHQRDWAGTRYRLEACGDSGCANAGEVRARGKVQGAIGYFKAFNTQFGDEFGTSVALSEDGATLAVGAPSEDSDASGIDGDQNDNWSGASGAVYIYRLTRGGWQQEAYVKASIPGSEHAFGTALALSADGNTLAVGATGENRVATGVNGAEHAYTYPCRRCGAAYVFTRTGGVWREEAYVKPPKVLQSGEFGRSVALSRNGDTLAVGSPGDGRYDPYEMHMHYGAVYVYTRRNGRWSKQAQLKPGNLERNDEFGASVALSGDGNTLAAGAPSEDGGETGVDANPLDNMAPNAGAVYVFSRSAGSWRQNAYLKASNASVGDQFGRSVALSGDGNILVAGAANEDGGASGIDGDQANDPARDAGAVYVFSRSGASWSGPTYIKAFNTGAGDAFGQALALSADGGILAIGARNEDSGASGIDGERETSSKYSNSGAVYVYARNGTAWSQLTYVKASNADARDQFGAAVALSGDGNTLAAGAPEEGSASTLSCAAGNPDCASAQADNSATSGAVYLY